MLLEAGASKDDQKLGEAPSFDSGDAVVVDRLEQLDRKIKEKEEESGPKVGFSDEKDEKPKKKAREILDWVTPQPPPDHAHVPSTGAHRAADHRVPRRPHGHLRDAVVPRVRRERTLSRTTRRARVAAAPRRWSRMRCIARRGGNFVGHRSVA